MMKYRSIQIFLILLLLLRFGSARAEVFIPGVFNCPDGTELSNNYDEEGKKVSNVTYCILIPKTEKSKKKKGVLAKADAIVAGLAAIQPILTSSGGYPVKTFMEHGDITSILNSSVHDSFMSTYSSVVRLRLDSEARFKLPDLSQTSANFSYSVDPSGRLVSKVTESYFGQFVTFAVTENPQEYFVEHGGLYANGLSKHYTRVSIAKGAVVAKKAEEGDLAVKSGFGQQFVNRPYTMRLSCEDEFSGTKLEFVLSAPMNPLAGNPEQDPLYLEFKINDKTVLQRKATDRLKLTLPVLAQAAVLRPTSIAKPLDAALDAAFDCFDHMELRERESDPSAPKVPRTSHDFFDEEVVMQQVRGVKLKDIPEMKKEAEAFGKNIQRGGNDCPTCGMAAKPVKAEKRK